VTYKELLAELQKLNEEQLNSDVSIYVCEHNEYYGIGVELVFVGEELNEDTQDALDVNCPVISVL
jgi:hypothetical protein